MLACVVDAAKGGFEPGLSDETIQNEVGPRLDANFRQNIHFIAKFLECAEKTMILCDAFVEIVPSFRIRLVNLRPRRRQKNAALKAIVSGESSECGYSSRMLQRNGRVHKPTVKEDPFCKGFYALPVARGHLECSSRESLEVDPWQRSSVTPQFFRDNPPPRLLDGFKPSPLQFKQQR